ncbi:sterol desaturase family protein [Sphingomonas parva]|uniref:Sterol desaturase family protein n=1 Tax=Sphingomonas parva TaxID=2555898 RepID=A0A4Y8ZWF3_9SPHN|nr:sterol desaturase family protein [Sphingomonas parva]TFI59475.1 sterol desaturase family protein [Sphingomonas parva]
MLRAALPIAGALAMLALLTGLEVLRPLHRAQPERRGRLLTNFGLGLINLLMVLLLPLGSVAAAEWARGQGFGLLPALGVPAVAAAILTIAARSLLIYGVHRLAHRVPLLWRFHRVHHRDTAVDLSTGFRHHPIEVLYVALAAAALAAGLGLSPAALAGYEIAAAALSLWSHANHRLAEPVDRLLGVLLFTPALHHVHHSAHQPETDSNYGDALTLWDRVFGTYRRLPHASVQRLRFGLGPADDRHAGDLLVQLCDPLIGRKAPQEERPVVTQAE